MNARRKKQISLEKILNRTEKFFRKAKSKLSEIDSKGPFTEYPFKNYSEIYNMLMANLSLGVHNPRSIANKFIVIFLFFGLPIMVATYPEVLSWPIQYTIFLLIVTYFFTVYIMGIILTGVFAVRDSTKSIPIITLRLVICFKRPYLDETQFGLTYQDIEHIKRYAQAEQDSADWKGAVINIIIIGSISTLVATFSLWGKILFRNDELIELYNFVSTTFPPWAGIVFFILFVVFISQTLYKFLIYLLNFLSRESSTQIIRFACEDAQGLLEAQNLHTEIASNLEKRLNLANYLDFKIVQPGPFHLLDSLFWPTFIGPDNHLWHIIPNEKFEKREKYYSFLKKVLKILGLSRGK